MGENRGNLEVKDMFEGIYKIKGTKRDGGVNREILGEIQRDSERHREIFEREKRKIGGNREIMEGIEKYQREKKELGGDIGREQRDSEWNSEKLEGKEGTWRGYWEGIERQ